MEITLTNAHYGLMELITKNNAPSTPDSELVDDLIEADLIVRVQVHDGILYQVTELGLDMMEWMGIRVDKTECTPVKEESVVDPSPTKPIAPNAILCNTILPKLNKGPVLKNAFTLKDITSLTLTNFAVEIVINNDTYLALTPVGAKALSTTPTERHYPISMIYASGYLGEVGKGSDLPWGRAFPTDLNWFKHITSHDPENTVLVVGSKTFAGLPPLKNRHLAILTRDLSDKPKGSAMHTWFDDIDTLLETYSDKHIIVIGGAEIYRLFMDKVDILYHTNIRNSYPNADVHYRLAPEDAFRFIRVINRRVDDCDGTGVTVHFTMRIRDDETVERYKEQWERANAFVDAL